VKNPRPADELQVAHLSARENALLATELDVLNPAHSAPTEEADEYYDTIIAPELDPDSAAPAITVTSVAHSWVPIDIVKAAASPPEPPTIGGTLYPKKRALLSGPTESLKTWLGLILSKAEIDAGYSVAWADLDAMGAGEILARLRLLGVSDELISQRFLYYAPDGSLKGAALDDVVAEISERSGRLFVIDAFNPALNLHGLDPNKTSDIETFWREVADPICNAGAAPTVLDHVAKEGGGKYAYGSERKASGAHVHIGFKSLGPAFKRGGTGRAKLTTHKDRAGFLPRPVTGVLELVSTGTSVTYSLTADRSRTGDKFRPTHLMERVSQYLALKDDRVPKGDVEANVTGKGEAIRTAIDVLVEEGFVDQTPGKYGADLLEFVRHFREEEDALLNDETTSSQPRPNLVPSLVSTPLSNLVPSSHPQGDEDEVEGSSPSPTSSPSSSSSPSLPPDFDPLEAARSFDAMYPPRGAA
jgi:hypothetical protein